MAILMALDVFPIALLFPLLYNPTITLELMSCPTQSWNMWAINYTKISTKDFLIQGVPWCWLICAVNSIGVQGATAVFGRVPHAGHRPLQRPWLCHTPA